MEAIMSGKKINLNKTVYELCNDYPELSSILSSLGFKDITKPGMLATMGRFMTIPKGAVAKKIDLDMIKFTLSEHGFEITDL
jgi:selenophosphate synthetase-related protein